MEQVLTDAITGYFTGQGFMQKPVWCLTASTKLDGPMHTQERVDHDIATVLQAFPPGAED
jgi:hypothetical protein